MRSPQTRQERWRQRNPLKHWAHAATRSAVLRGLIEKPDHCEDCGRACTVEAHHSNHRDPLRVAWLCRKCHKRLHRGEQRGATQ